MTKDLIRIHFQLKFTLTSLNKHPIVSSVFIFEIISFQLVTFSKIIKHEVQVSNKTISLWNSEKAHPFIKRHSLFSPSRFVGRCDRLNFVKVLSL